jgi:SAM-dependent methyltransferase
MHSRPLASIACAALLLGTEAAAQTVSKATPPARTQPKGRLFPPQDLGLLNAPDRALWQKPDQIMDALAIADGAVVADLGAGDGWFTIQLARRVGPNGVVYAEDIQPQMIEAIRRRMQHEQLANVRAILGTPNDPRLPRGLDAALIVDVYHEIEDPVALLKNVARSLKPQGRLGLVVFNRGGGGPGPAPDQRVDPDGVVKAAVAAGFELISREALPFQTLMVFVTSAGSRKGDVARSTAREKK